jgi:cyclopropane fatty-acyl-phospholipid synthase-like methyltransferase
LCSQKDFSEYINEDGTFKPEFYDADYYESGKQSGKGWLENYRWMPRRTLKEAYGFIDYLGLDDSSYVLDWGCGKGFIVKALRILEIKADGCDISEYSLQFAPDGCWNCSTDESWEQHRNQYTHIIIKDVLEHLTVDQLKSQLQKFKIVAPKIMTVIPMGDNGLYRIPEYHTEVSHLIIENENWWRKTFFDAGWKVIKDTPHVNGIKDNWEHVHNGNHVFVLEKMN